MLTASVLVLNRGWTAVNIIDVKRAISLIYSGVAKIVDEDYNLHAFQSWKDLSRDAVTDYIKGVDYKFKLPRVIILTMFDKLPRRNVKYTRKNIFLRDGCICAYCGKKFALKDLTLDHVIPRSKGGKSTWENTVSACIDCNCKKANMLPEEVGLTLKVTPYRPRFVPIGKSCISYRAHKSWEKFVDYVYWNTELEE